MKCAKERKWGIVSNGKLNRIPIKRKLIIGWNKRTKISAIIGGLWGLIAGMLYAWGVFALGFSGHGEIGTLSKNMPTIWKIIFLPAYLTDIISGFLGNSLIIIASLLGFSFFIIWCIGIPILFGIIIGILASAIIEKKIAVDKMTKNYIGLTLAGIICIFGMFGIIPLACAEETGELTLDLTPDATVMKTAQEFQLMHVKIVKLTDETEVVFFESDIIEQEDINMSVPAGTYKLYVQLQGHRTIWELDNESRGYEVSAGSTTVVPLWENTLLKDVFADAPWRTETGNIPILVMVKDATGIAGDYDLGNVEIYLDEDCDKDNNEADDILLETVTKWYDVTVSGSSYNLYYPGDWYGITYLDPSEHDLSGEACFHVVIRDIGGWFDPDSDTHSHFNVNIATDTLPALTNWHAGDTHYHSSYTDNAVEFGFPVEATVEAGKVIGLDWNAITDHSFDIRDSKTVDPNHKFNALKSDVSSYTTGSYRLILGEEVSCYGHKNPSNPLVPRGVVHFLIYGMENFNNVRGTGLDFIPGSHDEKPEGGLTWNLEDVIDVVNSQDGVSYAAHPEGHRDASAAAFDRVPWIIEDYDLVGYNGLQVWNMMDKDHERDLGLEQWKRLLLNGRKDIFIAGGSDAHGDFSHATTVIEPMDNAFGKVRTYIYCEEFTEEGILNALKNGHSIMTDGPLVIFNITNERSETAIIGHEITGYDLTLNIQWESTSEFGNISHIYVHRGIINETEIEISEYNLTPDNFSGASVYLDLAGKVPLMKNGYIRINATTDKGHSVYTNPIWINSPASIISNVSVTGITTNSTTITWDTNGPSDSLVKYSTESGNYTLSKYNHNNVTSHSINLTELLPNTTYYYYIVSTDRAGNTNESSIHTFTTLTVPVVTIHSPLSITNDSTPLLNATFDRIVTSARYVLDGNASSGESNIDHLTITLPELSDGPHRVVVDAIDYEGDYMGNIGKAIQNFLIDTSLPTTIITEPYEGAYVKETIDIVGTANDTNFKNYTIEWKNTSVDWTEIQNSPVFVSDGTLATWDTTTMEDGNYLIRLTVRDNASNFNITSVNVTIDNTPPNVIINSPANNSIVNSTNITILGNVTDDFGIKCFFLRYECQGRGGVGGVCGVPPYPTNITINQIVSLCEGWNLLSFDYIDVAGNFGNASIVLTLDTTPPTIISVTLNDNVVQTGAPIEVNVSANDDKGIASVTADGIPLTLIEGNYVGTITAGTSPVAVIVTDEAGNLAEDTSANYTIDDTEPELILELITEGNVRTIYINSSEPLSNCTVDNVECTYSSSKNWSETLNNPGEYNIIATDLAGNEALRNLTLEIGKIGLTSNNQTNYTIRNVTLNITTTLEVLQESNITICEYDENPVGSVETTTISLLGINKFVQIEVDTDLNDSIGTVRISINYSGADLSGIDEDSLKLYVWNFSIEKWEELETSGIDKVNKIVLGELNHLSLFSILGEEPTEEVVKDDNGGGGGSSGEDFYNIVLSETDRQSVFKNSDVSYSFDLEDNIVSHINFTALNSAGTISAKVEILNNTSTLVSTPPTHEVFINLNIWVGNAGWGTKRNIADATVVFTVEKSWITKNNIDESSIALYRYSDDTWHELVTRKIAEDANSLQFEAETPGFSPFAVTGKTIGEPGGEGIIKPTVTAEKTPAPTQTEEKGMPGFGLFAGLLVLLIAVQLLRKKK